MVRLIDADVLIEFIVEEAQDLRTLSTKTVGQAISKTPTIDAVPVRHGKWIFGSTLGHSWMKCSECCVSQDGQTLCFSYCPNCGAKMDGEQEERRMKEYIMPIDDRAFDWDEMFVGVIRKQEELIRCKDSKHYDIQVQQCTCEADWFGIEPNGFCSRAERKEG